MGYTLLMQGIQAEVSGMDALREKARAYLSPAKLEVVEQAYQFALQCHQGQTRLTGGPYLEHPLATAMILAELQLDASTLAAALLHDVPEDCGVPLTEITAKFGPEISKLVDGVTKLSKVSWPASPETEGTASRSAVREAQAQNLRKMLVAMAEDLRVVFIKLADRLHNMRTLDALPHKKQQAIAQETMDIYAPLAHRLGIWELKWQLEDLAFKHLEQRHYRQVAGLLASRLEKREQFVNEVTQALREELHKAGINAEVAGRPKHIYSVYQKMKKYADQGKEFDDIHDLHAVRVLVDNVNDCYAALGAIHNLWHPIIGEFDDYIASPKENGYQSLHTTVMYQGTRPLEIQIRTYEMHQGVEYGVAAHWRYKEGAPDDSHFEEKMDWLRQLVEWHRELSGAEEFVESVKTDIFIDQVFVYTPKGEIKELPNGSTPLDFAYRIHTNLGHRCVGAKVNGKLVSLSYQLHNGDTVEIMATKAERGPSLDWLNTNLGYVKTSHAREKIRQWFKKQERGENIERGRQLLEKELKRLGLPMGDLEQTARLFQHDNVDDFLAAVGYGGISPHQISLRLAVQQEQPRVVTGAKPAQPTTSEIQVMGVGDLLTQIAQCCHPVPGDDIIGYITRSRGISVHRKGCSNIKNIREGERLVEVEWGRTERLYPVSVRVEALDRVGLLRDISTVVAGEKVNIATVGTEEHDDHTASILLTLQTKGISQLSLLLDRIEGIRGVISVTRSSNGVQPS